MDIPLVPEDLPQYTATQLGSIHALVEKLESESADDHWLYRGQTRRGSTLVFPIDGGQADIEPMFPADFRFVAAQTSAPPGKVITAMREGGRDRRDRFTKWLCERATNRDVRLEWLIPLIAERDCMLAVHPLLVGTIAPRLDQNDAGLIMASLMGLGSEKLMRTCWSLAQHYCLPTCLLDCTKSVRVSAWFATHFWNPDMPDPSTGEGVIYRISRTKLIPIMEALGEQHYMRGLEMKRVPPMEMFIFDLDEIPESAARRPARQQGLSIYGFDRLELIQFAFYSGAVEIFTFPHGAGSFVDKFCTHDRLHSMSDPFCELVDEFLEENPDVRLNG